MNSEQSDSQLSTADRRRFNSRLKKLLPADSIINDAERLVVYESDALTARRAIPWIVVLPDSTSEVQEIMRLCSGFQLPVVASGAGV